jgi:hypothetical protein
MPRVLPTGSPKWAHPESLVNEIFVEINSSDIPRYLQSVLLPPAQWLPLIEANLPSPSRKL